MLKKSAQPAHPNETEFGAELRRFRKESKLTMQYVADHAGLSVGFISQVERGITVPSLSSLKAIASVLGKPMSHFLEPPHGSQNATRGKDRINFSVADNGLSYERLSDEFPGSTLRSVIVHEPSGHRGEPISHEGEEMFYMLDGELTVEVEGVRTILRRGDSLHFDSTKTHSTWNHTTKVASMLWCGTMDVFGEGTNDPVHKVDAGSTGNDRKTEKKT